MRFAHVAYEFPARSLVIDGLRVAYADIDTSHGPPVVFLHGVGGSSNWFADCFRRLQPTNRVVGVDWIGFGKSDKPRLDDPVPFYVGLLARLLDELEIRRATIVGHSMGGLVAGRFAIEHPDRVERLVLAAPAGIREVPTEARPAILDFWSYNRVQNMDPVARRAWYEALVAGWNDRLEHVYELQVQLAEDLEHRAWARACEAAITSVLEHPLADALGRIQSPTLVVWGVDDHVVPFSNAAIAAEAIPGAQLVAIEGCGHLPMFERPDEFADAVVEFVTSGTVARTGRRVTGSLTAIQDVTPWPGLTVEIGRIATQLFEQREACLDLSRDLSLDEIAWSPEREADSIGGLLLHLGGEVAWHYYEVLLEGTVPDDVSAKYFLRPGGVIRPYTAPRKSAERLLREVAWIDEQLRTWLAQTTDASLNRVFKDRSTGRSATLRRVLWHLVEDAVACRGQIAYVRRLIELRRQT